MRNKANWPVPITRRHRWPRPPVQPPLGTSVQNKANLPGAGRNGRGPAKLPMPAPRDQSVQNKANSCAGGKTGKYFVEKDLWRIEHAMDLEKTKPISGGAGGTRSAGRGPGGLYKQTQFGRGLLCETKPICPGRTGRGAGPGPERRPPAGISVQNEANSRPGPTRGIWNPPRHARHPAATTLTRGLLHVFWDRV